MQFKVCRNTTKSSYKQAHQLGNTDYNKTRQTTYPKNASICHVITKRISSGHLEHSDRNSQ
jgi:hypothetical protein